MGSITGRYSRDSHPADWRPRNWSGKIQRKIFYWIINKNKSRSRRREEGKRKETSWKQKKKKIKKLVIFPYHQGKVDKASLRDLLMCNWFLEAAEVVFRGFNANLV